MRIIVIAVFVCAVAAAFADGMAEGILLPTNDLPALRKAYPFFDGISPDIPEGDIRRREEWETDPYSITELNTKGERVLCSKTEITLRRLIRRKCRTYGCYTSFGQLAKICDGVFVGEIVEARYLSEEDERSVKKGVCRSVGLTFRVETNLFGRIPTISALAPMMWYGGKPSPEVGKKVMVFYAKGYTWDVFDNLDFKPVGFDWEKPPEDPNAQPSVPLKRGSCLLFLDTPELESACIEVVGRYLQLLRHEKRDPDRFYVFLRSLVKSPVLRIRQDAREDMLHLLGPRGPDRFDLQRVLGDPELLDFFKDFVRFISMPVREKRKAGAPK